MNTAKSLFDYELENWLSSFKGEDIEKVRENSESQKRKEDALRALEIYQEKVGGDNFKQIVDAVNNKAPEVRAAIERLVYEGTLSDNALAAVLKENAILRDTVDNACLQCLECTSCATCGLCIFTGVAAAAVTSTVGSAASHAY